MQEKGSRGKEEVVECKCWREGRERRRGVKCEREEEEKESWGRIYAVNVWSIFLMLLSTTVVAVYGIM